MRNGLGNSRLIGDRSLFRCQAPPLVSGRLLLVVNTTFSGVARLDALASVVVVNPAP